MIIILFVIWLLYSVLEGVREALSDAGDFDCDHKHDIYTLQRFLMGSSLVMVLYFFSNLWLPCLFLSLAIVLGFSFLHNGFYFISRNFFAKQKLYPEGFKSKGSTAVFELGFVLRTILFIISIGLILTSLFLL